ncbi:MAG: hypothetical protein ING24_07540 [Roseomonas sp.]|nr:hypothetical protein [Roseomonas sp.]MCA3342277.1 hypothetical protein [Roseomonas sp.]
MVDAIAGGLNSQYFKKHLIKVFGEAQKGVSSVSITKIDLLRLVELLRGRKKRYVLFALKYLGRMSGVSAYGTKLAI